VGPEWSLLAGGRPDEEGRELGRTKREAWRVWTSACVAASSLASASSVRSNLGPKFRLSSARSARLDHCGPPPVTCGRLGCPLEQPKVAAAAELSENY